MNKARTESTWTFWMLICLATGAIFWGCSGGGGGDDGDGPPGGVDPHPQATIISPESGRRFLQGDTINLAGSGQDAADGALSGSAMVWVSSMDGQLGTGTSVSMTDASVGVHQITLTVTDSDGLSDTDAIFITVGNDTPTVTIHSPPDGKRFELGETIIFKGSAHDSEDGLIPEGDLIWRSDRDGDLGAGAEISISNLIGTHVITLSVTDSDGTTAEEQITIHVGDTFPLARIIRPEDRTIFDPGETIIFSGEGESAREGRLSGNALVWISNRDGQISTGTFFTTNSLSNGAHTINLIATDTDGETGSDAIVISIGNTPPKVEIVQPMDETLFQLGAFITFEGKATDVEDGTIPGASLTWVSDRDGTIGTGNAISSSALTEGTHTITLTARDTLGEIGQDEITVWVGRAGPGFNTPPTAEILSPEENTTFQLNEFIFFEGKATDVQDGVLSGSALVWTSNLNGDFGTGTSVTTNRLMEGTHTIALTATDRDGSEGVAAMTIFVGNTPPAVEILSPPMDKVFQIGEYVTLEGRAIDTEDGVMSGDAMVWSSNLNGELGTGTSVTTNVLSAGKHTITLIATDSLLATGSAILSITVSVNIVPSVNIVSPDDEAEFEMGDSVTLIGQAEDTEDGTLIGGALVWTSKLGGVSRVLGGGTTVTINDLARGIHVITLTATDSNGNAGQDAITLFVGNAPPTVEITNPADGSEYDKGNTVILTGIAEDPEDGALSGDAMIWTSSIDDEIGRGATVVASDLSEGRHTITLTATDAENISGNDSIIITVGNTLPTASIVFPTDRAQYDPGNYIVFTGTGTDLEDGTLSGDSLEWTSSIDGLVGTGTSLRLNTLSEGTHIVTLTAFDKDDGAGSTAITIFVGNAEPAATITKPSKTGGNTEFYEGEVIEFEGTGFDQEDGLLGGDNLVWTVDGANVLGTGDRITTDQLPPGVHTVTLTVTDNDGATDTDNIQITILGI